MLYAYGDIHRTRPGPGSRARDQEQEQTRAGTRTRDQTSTHMLYACSSLPLACMQTGPEPEPDQTRGKARTVHGKQLA